MRRPGSTPGKRRRQANSRAGGDAGRRTRPQQKKVRLPAGGRRSENDTTQPHERALPIRGPQGRHAQIGRFREAGLEGRILGAHRVHQEDASAEEGRAQAAARQGCRARPPVLQPAHRGVQASAQDLVGLPDPGHHPHRGQLRRQQPRHARAHHVRNFGAGLRVHHRRPVHRHGQMPQGAPEVR